MRERERVGINTECLHSPGHCAAQSDSARARQPAPAHNPQIERCSESWSQAINGNKLLAHQLAMTHYRTHAGKLNSLQGVTITNNIFLHQQLTKSPGLWGPGTLICLMRHLFSLSIHTGNFHWRWHSLVSQFIYFHSVTINQFLETDDDKGQCSAKVMIPGLCYPEVVVWRGEAARTRGADICPEPHSCQHWFTLWPGSHTEHRNERIIQIPGNFNSDTENVDQTKHHVRWKYFPLCCIIRPLAENLSTSCWKLELQL